jgi:hypothetical protein
MSFIPENIIVSNCPDGFSWDAKTHECVKQPGKPPEVVPGTEGMCPVGYVLDPNLLCCVPGTPDNGGCDPGYYMSAAAQLCIPIQQNGCPVGYTYDPYWGCMKQVHQGDGGPAGCPDGTHLSTDGKTCLPDQPVGVGDFTCPPGSDYVQGQGCVTSTVGAPPVQCPQNSYYDYKLKMCVGLTQYGCPAGTYLDPNLKQCMPLSGPWTGCPQNYLINPKTGCCIPVPGTDNSDCIGSQDGKGPTPIPGIVANIQGYDPGQSTCPPPADIICAPGYHPNQDATICLPNDCPKGTGPTPNNPNGCFPQGTEPCPPGYEMSNSGLGCVPIMADSIVYQ